MAWPLEAIIQGPTEGDLFREQGIRVESMSVGDDQ